MTKRILRVFPKRTNFTPDDDMVYIGRPPFVELLPQFDEAHISCMFSWDIEYCRDLKEEWQERTGKPALLGGPAFPLEADAFVPGRYVKSGVTITSRGCDNSCPYCLVPKKEGALRAIKIHPGNIIQDNNFLQCPKRHKDRVFSMLRGQREISFKGGLQPSLVDYHFIEAARNLRISELWLSCDTPGALAQTVTAIRLLLGAGFKPYQLNCYVLIGRDRDEEENRCSEIYKEGCMPRAQLLRKDDPEKTTYSDEWRAFETMWQRPAATVTHMKHGTSHTDFMKRRAI